MLLVATLLQGAAPLPPRPEAVLKLEPYRRGVAAHVVIAGKPRLFLFDTGGGISVVSPEVARESGCTQFGTLVGLRMTGDKLEMPRCDHVALAWNGTPLTSPHAGIFDVAPLLAPDAPPMDGMLALDIFAGRTITLDFAGGALTIETPASAAARIQGAVAIPARLAREIGGRSLAVYIDVPSPKGPLSFELDSGNGGTLLVSKQFAGDLGLDPNAAGPKEGAITVAPGIVAKGFVMTPDLAIDGNLGMPFLKNWIVTLDLAKGGVWLKRNPIAAPPGMGVPPPPK